MTCPFLHHFKWKWVLMGAGNGKAYRYWRGECKFCHLFTNRAR